MTIILNVYIFSGLDLDCRVFYPKFTLNATKHEKVRETDIDKALNNLYVVLMRPFLDIFREEGCVQP